MVVDSSILVAQANLACTYTSLGRNDEALEIRRDVYFKRLKLLGQEDRLTLSSANNYASSLIGLQRFKEAKALMRKMMPLARRVLGESHDNTLRMRLNYAKTLYREDGATLDGLREAMTTLEETSRTARRVFGGAHPLTRAIEVALHNAREVLRAREAGKTVVFETTPRHRSD